MMEFCMFWKKIFHSPPPPTSFSSFWTLGFTSCVILRQKKGVNSLEMNEGTQV